jgi:hypothetical protein
MVEMKRIVRTLHADATIDPDRPTAAYVKFRLSADEEIVFEMPVAILQKLGVRISAVLQRVGTPARRRKSGPSATSRNK